MTVTGIVVGGTTYASMDAIIAERMEVLAKLNALFAGYDPDKIAALYADEPDIVRLFNSYQALSEAIDRHTQLQQRNENIRAAWQLVRELKKDSNA